MRTPRYGKQELWDRFLGVSEVGDIKPSLTGSSSHTILSIDRQRREYLIEYNTEKRSHAKITLDDLYAVYRELYRNGWLNNEYMNKHVKQILGWSSWHAPGSAMFAILPQLDESIDVRGGALHISDSDC